MIKTAIKYIQRKQFLSSFPPTMGTRPLFTAGVKNIPVLQWPKTLFIFLTRWQYVVHPYREYGHMNYLLAFNLSCNSGRGTPNPIAFSKATYASLFFF